jgi:hypothetical protein
MPKLSPETRSLVCDLACNGMNLVNKYIYTSRKEICWVDHLRWWLESRLEWCFTAAYPGSGIESEWEEDRRAWELP